MPRPAAPDHDLTSAMRVLKLEAKGIKSLAANLDGQFVLALNMLQDMNGRAVVAGMGKSGHVARKIAATLASTGTPAFFIHPAEASHGDLGMIQDGDILIALSNSGETPELADLVAYAKRYKIALIAITGNRASALAQAADIILALPAVTEACPMGLAPTTSTTVMMALGDAIAVALLERKGFSPDEFRALHPGGKLGQRLLRTSDVMHVGDELPLVPGAMLMADALLVITNKKFGCVGVVSQKGRLEGVITDGDLRRHMSKDLLQRQASDIMTKNVKTIRPNSLASEALQIMNEGKITNLFVVEEGRPVGILHIHDCLRAGVA